MKKINFILLLLGIALSSCSTYQYTARQTNVHRRAIDTHEQMAGIDVNYGKQVTATSDFQLTRQDAVQEAEYICIQQSKIDVIVDPIIKVEYNPFRIKTRYRATITGYAGTYKEEPTVLEKSKEYTLEEIEKYKLLTDPTFPQYYYNNGTQGDQYYFGTQGVESKKESSSLLIQSISPRQKKAPKSYDYNKALKLRNLGISTLVTGAVMMVGLGVGCFVGGLDSDSYYVDNSYYDYYYGYYVNDGYYRSRNNDAAVSAGIAFMAIGGAAITASIPMIAVGSVRTKKAQNMDITMNVGSNGIGLGLTF